MKKTMYSLGVKSISLVLSGVLVFQCTAPAFAEANSNSFMEAASAESAALDAKLDNIYTREATSDPEIEKAFKREIQRQISNITPLANELSGYRQTGKRQYGKNYIAYANTVGINTIGRLTYELKQFMGGMFVEPKVISFNEFKKEYDAYIKKEAEDYVKANNSALSFTVRNTLGNSVTKHITVDMMIESIKKEFPAKTLYNEYVANANKEIKWFKANQNKINEEYYKVLRTYVKAFGPENISFEAARLLANLKLNGKPVILPEEKTIIYNYAVGRLANEDLKAVFDISLFSSSATKNAKTKVAGRKLQDLADLMIIGAYMSGNNNEAYAKAVQSLIYRSLDTPAFPHILNAGFGSLLGLKRYDKLDSILNTFTNQENGVNSSFIDNLDKFSFEYIGNSVVMNAKFLRGTPSKNAQYEINSNTAYKSYRNGFTDIARLLAEEGSPSSLNLLKKYSIGKGLSSIYPFLVGALESKKSGATVADVARFAGSKANAQQILNNEKLSADAFIALKIANLYMDDVYATQEYDIDLGLMNAYPAIKSKLTGGAIVNAEKLSEKASRRNTQGYFNRAFIAGDIAFMVWATFDLAKLATKAVSFSKAMYISIKTLKIADPAVRSAAIMKNLPSIKRYVKARSSLVAFSGRMKGAMAGVVLSQRNLYTAQALPKIAGAGAENTTTARILGTVTANAAGDGLTVNKAAAMAATAGEPGRVAEITKIEQTLNLANNAARENYLNRNFLNKYRSYSSFLASATQDAFRAQGYTGYSLEAGLSFGDALKGSNFFKAPSLANANAATGGINFLARPLSALGTPAGVVELSYRTATGADAMAMPVNVSFANKVPGIRADKVSRVLLTEKGDKIFVSVAQGEKMIDPAFFKIGVSNSTFANLARMSLVNGQPLNLKFMAEPATFGGRLMKWGRDFFTSKSELFGGTGSVFVREGGVLKPTNITLATPKEFSGVKVVVGGDNSISVVGRNNLGQFARFKNPYMFALPKGELPRFMQYAKGASFQHPLEISLAGAKNKINTLFAIQFLSLSAASTGLIGPLRKNYPEMSNTQEALIAVVLPYASSFLSPVWAPFVKRFGSANMMKASLGLAGASLMIPTLSGFYGFGDVNDRNPNKPSLYPLLVSGTLIGLSSSITRASFNPLMDAIGGGAGQFKSFMFKNLSGYAMLVPPALATGADLIWPRYYTNPDGTPEINDKGEKVKHPWTDFSLYNPVLLGITGAIFYKFHTSRMPTHIGRVEGYTFGANANLLKGTGWGSQLVNATAGIGKEAWASTKTIVRPEVLPFTLAATGALGVEASMFNKYSNAQANEYTENYFGIKNPAFKPIVAMASISLAQLLTRKYSKPLLNIFGGDNPLGYKRLTAASLLTAGAGVGLLSVENDPYSFILGASLVGVGFANTTTGFKMLGQSKLKDLGVAKSVLTEWNVAYPAVHIGMALLPTLHNWAADRDRENDPELSKTDAMQNNVWIPALTLAGSGFFYSKGIGLLNTAKVGKYIAPLGHTAAFAFPIGRGINYWNNNPLQYKPALTAPQFDFNMSQPTLNTIMNLGGNNGINQNEATAEEAK